MSYTQGKFDKAEVLSMEKEIVTSIGTFMHPPTSGCFALMLLNEFSGSSYVTDVIDTCQFMIELATCGENPHRCCLMRNINCRSDTHQNGLCTHCRLLFRGSQTIRIGSGGCCTDDGANAEHSAT